MFKNNIAMKGNWHHISVQQRVPKGEETTVVDLKFVEIIILILAS